MPRKNKVFAWQPKDDDGEVLVPSSLRIALCYARTLGLVPARLRRVRTGWSLSISPTYARLQRLAVLVNTISLIALIVYAMTTDLQTVTKISFFKLFYCVELLIVLITYVLGVWTAQTQLKALMNLLQRLHKVNNRIHIVKINRKSKEADVAVVGLILWNLSLYFIGLSVTLTGQISENKIDVPMNVYFGIYYYFVCAGTVMRLIISSLIYELASALTSLNDQLQHLLKKPIALSKDIELKLYINELKPQNTKMTGDFMKDARLHEESGVIRHMNQCHGAICDMVAQVDFDSGPFLLLSVMFLFLQLLLVLRNALPGLGSLTVKTAVTWIYGYLLYTFELVVVVEPCQRLRDQMDRTRFLLGRLVGLDQCAGVNPVELEVFILQAQLRDVALAPMGVVTISRHFLASLIGGIVTFFIIVYQLESAYKLQ